MIYLAYNMLTLEDELENSGTIIGKVHSLDGPEKPTMNILNLSVIHSENGRPIRNALISIESIGKTAICNSNGEVSLTEIKPGKYEMDVISPGFIAQRVSIIITAKELTQVSVKMLSNG
jgi:hypothetical protein